MRKRIPLFKTIILLLNFLSSWCAFGDSSTSIDSLKKLLKGNINDTLRCRILVALAETADDEEWPLFNEQSRILCLKQINANQNNKTLLAFYRNHLAGALNNKGFLSFDLGQLDSSLHYHRESLRLYKELNNKLGMAIQLKDIGRAYSFKDRPDSALIYYKKSIDLYKELKNNDGIAVTLNDMAVLTINFGNIPKALDYYHQSLKLYEDLNDVRGIGATLNNIGMIYDAQNENEKAEEYYLKSLKYQQKKNLLEGIAYVYNNLGNINFERTKANQALNYHQKSLAIRTQIKDLFGMAMSYSNIGRTYFQYGDIICADNKCKENPLKIALDFQNKALTLSKQIQNKSGESRCLIFIAKILFKMGEIKKSQELGEIGLQMSRELGFPENILDASRTLAGIYGSNGDYKNAYLMQVLFKQMNDSINNQVNKKASVQKAFQYEYEKKTMADSIKTIEERKVFDAQLKQEKTRRYTLYGGIILITIFSAFMFNRFKITQKQKGIIEKQKQEVDEAYDTLHEKNKEILDSIHYAARIQRSLITSEKYIASKLKKLNGRF